MTQRLVSALSAQTNYGALYNVDMRLRPSGRSGPVATMLGSFESYQENEAWTWEHLALTRARVVSGPPAFAARVEKVIRDVLCRRARCRDDRRRRGRDARRDRRPRRATSERWDLKYVAGGLVDLEFIAQYLQLVHAAEKPEILDTATARVLDKAARLGLLAPEDADVLRPAVRLYQNLTQILRLCLSGRSIRRRPGRGCSACWRAPPTCPTSPRSKRISPRRRRRVRASFVRILGKAPLAQRFELDSVARRMRSRAAAVDRQAHQHDRADAERRADAHRAAMQFGQRLRDREAQGPSRGGSW